MRPLAASRWPDTHRSPRMDASDRPAIDQLYTLTEASRLTGRSVDALRQRAKRGRLEMVKGNDGLVRVRLTSADMTELRLDGAGDTDQSAASQDLDDNQTIKGLERELASQGEALSRERDRADRSEKEAAGLRELLEKRAEALTEALVRAAGAEGEARILKEALEDARRPFWRRWLG